jgi:signal transduction histidine kinase
VYNVFRRSESYSARVDHLFRKDGSMFYAESSAQPIMDGDRLRGAVVTFRDVTQTRLAEQALRRSEKLAAVGQLASSIAHEINNPLEAVTNLLYLIRESDSLQDVKTYAGLAEMELARVNEITIQTLRFHRQQAKAAPLDLGEVLPAILRLYATRFQSRQIRVDLRMMPTPPALLMEGEIRQVLNNLIRNAHDAMAQGGWLHVRVRPGSRLQSNDRDGGKGGSEAGVRITIADTGTGFLPHMRKHLFEPFHTSKEATGTGLGLWISKEIVEKHRGRLTMRSRSAAEMKNGAGRTGTVFVLWLPLG